MLRPVTLMLVAALAGCSSSSTYLPMTVAVRDRTTQMPVGGAVVHARSVHFFLPVEPYAILDSSPPRSARGVTGADGNVTLSVIVDHPVQMVVVAPGYPPVVLDLVEHPAVDGPSEWWPRDSSLAATEGEHGIEFRLLP